MPAPGHPGAAIVVAGTARHMAWVMARNMAHNAARQRGPKGRCRTGMPYGVPSREGTQLNNGELDRVICLATCKGGVSKTSLTANLAGLSAKAEIRTLVVDLDPQGDLADDLGFFDDPGHDQGELLATSILSGEPLRPVIKEVRPNLDVIPGGAYLADVAVEVGRTGGIAQLAQALAPVTADYQLVFIDTPPTGDALQLLALRAARWLLVPTKADSSSIRAIQRIATQMVEARGDGHVIDILGVVLVGVPTAATRVRRDAEDDVRAVLGDVAPLFEGGIRDSAAVARRTRATGILAHELAERAAGAEPFWKALRESRTPDREPRSAPALAEDYVQIADQVLRRLVELEAREG